MFNKKKTQNQSFENDYGDFGDDPYASGGSDSGYDPYASGGSDPGYDPYAPGGSQPGPDPYAGANAWDDGFNENYLPKKTRGRGGRAALWSIPVFAAAVILLVVGLFLKKDIVPPGAGSTPPQQTTDSAPQTQPPAPTQAPQDSPLPTPSPTPSPTPTPEPAADSDLYYCRSLLSSEEQQMYDRFAEAIEQQRESVEDLHVSDTDRVFRVLDYVMADHPEYFWSDGASGLTWYEEENGFLVTLNLSYSMDRAERDQLQPRFDAIADQLCRSLGGLSEYERVKGVYDYVIDHTVYDTPYFEHISNGGEYDPSFGRRGIYAVLMDGRGICEEYAQTVQYLLQQMGVQVIRVGGDNHAWNIVRIDGDYYQLDATWGDPVSDDGTQSKNYIYFCLTDEEMYRNHTREGDMPVPACTATACNYFRHEGLYIDRYDEDWVRERLRASVAERKDLIFRVSDEGLYNQYFNRLIEEAGICRLLEEIGEGELAARTYFFSFDDTFYIASIGFSY